MNFSDILPDAAYYFIKEYFRYLNSTGDILKVQSETRILQSYSVYTAEIAFQVYLNNPNLSNFKSYNKPIGQYLYHLQVLGKHLYFDDAKTAICLLAEFDQNKVALNTPKIDIWRETMLNWPFLSNNRYLSYIISAPMVKILIHALALKQTICSRSLFNKNASRANTKSESFRSEN